MKQLKELASRKRETIERRSGSRYLFSLASKEAEVAIAHDAMGAAFKTVAERIYEESR